MMRRSGRREVRVAEEIPVPAVEEAFCIGCGYRLNHLESRKCPECGRGFDPADARTMSLGRPLRGWQRWLLGPVSWPVVTLAVVGTLGLAYLSGWPGVWPVPIVVLVGEFKWPNRAFEEYPVADLVFFGAVAAWGAFLASFGFFQLARLLVPRAARAKNRIGADPRWRLRVVAVAGVISLVLMIFGWTGRIGTRWMGREIADAGSVRFTAAGRSKEPLGRPVELSPSEAARVLERPLSGARTLAERIEALKLLNTNSGKNSCAALMRAEAREKDLWLRVAEVHLIGLCRNPDSESLLTNLLHDGKPAIRAAAADAIGILRKPAYSINSPVGGMLGSPSALAWDEEISLRSFFKVETPVPADEISGHDLMDEPQQVIQPSLRATLEQMMLIGPTSEEREAAARTLVNWPPEKYSFRVAEWGVWINQKGNLSLARSVVDEIPPFVHSTGNPLDSLSPYFLYPGIVDKPIIHITSDGPLSSEIEVEIRKGRPWYAYPMPDDFLIQNQLGEGQPGIGNAGGLMLPETSSSPADFDDFIKPNSLEMLVNCREGYPWLLPHHRLYSSGGTNWGSAPLVVDLGLRWQSVIVSPDQLRWMSPPVVPSDNKFSWWRRLRGVPCSWVSSRGESERFLYYDGPTQSPVPMAVSLPFMSQLFFDRRIPPGPALKEPMSVEEYPKHRFEPMKGVRPAGLSEHEGLYIDDRGDRARGQYFPQIKVGAAPLAPVLPLEGEALVQRFRQMFTDYGLTTAEAEGLVAAWSPQFFHAKGRRFILRMSPEEYAKQCPMQVRPTPTEVVRLGLVLFEFDEGERK